MTQSDSTFGLLTDNALVGCPEVLIVAMLEALTFPGTITLLKHVNRVRERYEPATHLVGLLGNAYREGFSQSRELLEQLRKLGGQKVLDTVIHRAEAISCAANLGAPLAVLQPKHRS